MTSSHPAFPPKVSLGKRGETIAAQHLKQQGFTLVALNWRLGKLGEVDIIAQQPAERLLLFVEVKTRKNQAYGTPFEAITPSKQQQIVQLAESYLQQNPSFLDHQIRFDAISISFPGAYQPAQVEHIENAFESG